MRGRDLAQARRLETGLIGLRWFVVMLGGLLTFLTVQDRTDAPGYAVPLGFVLVAVLAIGNVAITLLVERTRRPEQLSVIGLAAFVLDIAVITGLVWIGTDSPEDATWVIAYLLPLEGAIRYGLAGALLPVAVTIVSELSRQVTHDAQGLHTKVAVGTVVTRVGMELVVAIVAGLMARSMQREADLARERATLAENAVAREQAARGELAAFQTAILAGVASEDQDGGLQSMAEAIARDLGFGSFSILLSEDGRLVPRAVHGEAGFPVEVPLVDAPDVVERALQTGTALMSVDERGASEAAAPLRVGDEAIGVLYEHREPPHAIDQERLGLLTRLAQQVALVVRAAQLHARQQETLRRLRELDDMKSDFVAITSHELRTPLAAVRGFVNTLRRRIGKLSPEEVEEFLGIIDQQTDRLIRLVEDLLVVSRIEAGKIAFHPESIGPPEFLDGVVRGLGDGAPRVEVFCDPTTPDRMFVDPHRLGQVLTNLLQNALKFSPSAEPVMLRTHAEGERVSFSVTDHGVGVPQDEQRRIFERFHQTDAASTRKAEGAGLGLYITRRLVEAMGGEIALDSEVGRGSTFSVRLPAHQAASPAPARLSAGEQAD
ncbi:MAG: ATP-binding protein [Actinomycetota bacterium]